MKKAVLFLLFVSFSVFLTHNQLFAQSAPCWTTPPHPSVDNNYDGRNTKYLTLGNQGVVNWISTSGTSIWTICGGNYNYGLPSPAPYPTPNPTPNNHATNIYYQISSGDIVTVPEIKLNTNTTLLVCGHLIVKGETSVEVDGDLGTNNHAKIIVCPGGTLTLDKLNANRHIEIVVDGTLVVNVIAGASETQNCIYGTGTIVNNDGTSPQSNISGFSYGTTLSDCQNDPNNFGGILPIDLLSFVSVIKPDRIF